MGCFPIFNNFCGCCSLRTGALFACCFHLVTILLIIYNDSPYERDAYISDKFIVDNFNISRAELYSWCATVIALALFGIFTKKKICLMPFLCTEFVRVFFVIVQFNTRYPPRITNSMYISYFFFIGIRVYMMLVLYNYYLEKDSGIVFERESNLFLPSAPNVPCVSHQIDPKTNLPYANPLPAQTYCDENVYSHSYNPYFSSSHPVVPNVHVQTENRPIFNPLMSVPVAPPPPYSQIQTQNVNENVCSCNTSSCSPPYSPPPPPYSQIQTQNVNENVCSCNTSSCSPPYSQSQT